jgi:catechol 2,3-dioxygenase-like lactoylglutathione lyase family enzyme
MANTFGTDILLQSPDIHQAAAFYIDHLGFTITGESPNLLHLEGPCINLYIEGGPKLGPILEVMVADGAEAKQRLLANGCILIKDEPEFPRTYVQDPQGLTYNLRASTS